MRKFLLPLLLLMPCFGMAQEQRTIQLDEAGTLDQQISEEEKYSITDLTITGNVNGKDFILLRDMAGAKNVSTKTDGKLASLDLSGASIVASDDVYFAYAGMSYKTSDNVVGPYLFLNADKLVNLKLPVNITEIGTQAFGGCTNVSAITIPEGVTTLGVAPFLLCNSITSIEVPNSVTAMGIGTFQRMEALQEVKLGNGITELDNSIFVADDKLKKVSLGKNLLREGFDPVVFYTLVGIEEIVVDEENPSIRSVDGVLFLKDLSEIISYPNARQADVYEIPAECSLVGPYSFCLNKGVKKVVIPSTVGEIQYSAFASSNIEEFEINEGVAYICEAAFSGLDKCAILHIPASAEFIEPAAFSFSYGLENIEVDENNPSYASRDGIFYDKSLSTLLAYPGGRLDESYTTEPGVTTIGPMAFAGDINLTSVTLSEDINCIQDMAFTQTEALIEVYCMPTNLTDVETYAFLSETLMAEGTLYVPEGTLDFYNAQSWVYSVEDEMPFFAQVKEMEGEGIESTPASTDTAIQIYDTAGRKLQTPRRGLNIVQQGDRVIKVLR